jgi:RNA polymerase sigma factor (sigma-70 family)
MAMPEPLVRLLHAAYAAPANGVTDAELLARVSTGKDDAAFELLVRRYAELVWRVCRASARDHHAAEDAFQATFLALATKAGTIRGEPGGWLYRVAYHAGLKARRASPPYSWAGFDSADDQPAAAGRSPEDAEVAALIHTELNRLADAYRLPVVLCHLHGLTQAEAAARLGLPLGTVATRVSRGLARLRERLSSRGVAVPGTGLVAALTRNADAALPRLIATAAAGAAPPDIFNLSEGALAAMRPIPWKAAAGLAGACLIAGAVAITAAGGRDEPARQPDSPPAAGKKFAPGVSTYTHRQQSRDRLSKVGSALHAFENAHGHFPTDILSRDGKPLLSWRVAILPELDQEYLYAQFKLDEPWDSEHNRKLLKYVPRAFATSVGVPGTFVKVFSGRGAAFEPGKKLTFADFTDGTSNTILAVEAGPAVEWTRPADLPYDPKKPLPAMDGPYRDRLFSLFADGSVQELNWNLDERTYRLLIERDDGNVIAWEPAPPSKPETEEDKKKAEQLRNYLVRSRDDIRSTAEERTKLIEELEKTGGVPKAEEIPGDASVEELERERRRLERRAIELWEDVERMRKVLAKRKK